MHDAQASLDAGDSFTLFDYENELSVFVWKKDDGALSVSIGHGNSDILQVIGEGGTVHAITSMTHKPEEVKEVVVSRERGREIEKALATLAGDYTKEN